MEPKIIGMFNNMQMELLANVFKRGNTVEVLQYNDGRIIVKEKQNIPQTIELEKPVIHNVKYYTGYGYADYCDYGNDSFVCQACGVAKCLSLISSRRDKNVCKECNHER